MTPDANAIFSLEAEMSALGSCMLSDAAAVEVASVIGPDHFYRESHRRIMAAMLALMSAGKPIDLVTMRAQLAKGLGSFSGNDLSEIGGEDYLIQIQEYVPSPANALHYAGIVRDKWHLRQMLQASKRVQRLILEGEKSLAEIRNEACDLLTEHVVTAPEVTALGDFPMDTRRNGIPSVFGPVNKLTTTKGYPCGQMTMICGGEKDGKSSYMISELVEMAENGYRCLYATFADLSGPDLQRRALKNLTGFYDLPDDDVPREEAAAMTKAIKDGVLRMQLDWEVDVYDASKVDEGYDVDTFAAWLRSKMESRRYQAVFLDYAQEMYTRDKAAGTDMVAMNNACASKISRLASKYDDTAFFVASQVSEGADGKVKTQWSRAWIAKAGLVVVIKRAGDNSVTVKIQESRFSASNQTIKGVGWNPKRIRFERVIAASQP